MVTTSFNQSAEISLQLPEAETGQPPSQEHIIEVTVDAQGHYYLGLQPLSGEDVNTLRTALQNRALETTIDLKNPTSATTTDQTRLLVIKADGHAPHQAVVRVMDIARQLGLTHITFSTQQSHPQPTNQ